MTNLLADLFAAYAMVAAIAAPVFVVRAIRSHTTARHRAGQKGSHR